MSGPGDRPSPAGAVVVAAATPPGRSALAVVRLTGAPLEPILDRVVRPLRVGPWVARRARRVEVFDRDGVFDDAVAVWSPGPRTATGEDLVELSVHGNPLVVERLVSALVDAGARVAAPGEFTRRAVIHGRLDLVQAEGVDQLIRATGAEGVRIAREAVTGRLGATMAEIRARLIGAVAELEARLDWPADDLAYQTDEVLVAGLADLADRCRALAETYRAGRIRVEGARVVLVGPVNAGKSSLFNALLGEDRALVHETPGTTRDVVEARTVIDGIEVTLLDTAGERTTTDPVEVMGLALARRMVDEADLRLEVVPAVVGVPAVPPPTGRETIVVYNGIDRPGTAPPPLGAVPTSAVTGAGVSALRSAIGAALGRGPSQGPVLASARQRDRLLAVARAVDEAIDALPVAGVAVAADRAIEALEEIDAATGADTREEILDAVFARFCIGK